MRYPNDELTIDIIEDLSQIERVWRDATARSVSYVFQCYDWLATWQASAGIALGIRPLLVCISDPTGRPVMLLPFGIQRFRGCRYLVFLGGRVSDYNAPVIDRTWAASLGSLGIVGLWEQLLRRLPPIDVVWLERMPKVIEGVPNPMIALPHAVAAENSYAATPLPTTFDAYARAHRAKDIKDAPRKWRKLAALGPVSFEILQEREAISATVETMLTQKRRRNRESGSWPLGPINEEFYKKIATCSLAGGQPHVSRLRVGDVVVATHLGAVYGDRFYWLMPGYEAEWAPHSVGRLLLREVLRWCISEGLETFDMTWGDESFKMAWADTSMPLYACQYAVTPKGRAFLALSRTLAQVAEKARRHPRFRNRIRALRRRISTCVLWMQRR
jgi:CelD/BcsL family acetyltransferase involved in cellulose biosynthesis